MNNKILLLTLAIFVISSVSAVQVCEIYDDFSSATLDMNKWEIRQDIEGQSFIDEYLVDSDLENFHMQQTTIEDKRTYLVPKHNFTTGDILEYDFNVISKEGNYMQFDLLTGDQYIRLGIMGYLGGVQGYDELGISHIKIEFQENNLHLERTTPSGEVLIDNLALANANGNYELYVGSVFTNLAHIDFDNFELCTEQEEQVLEVYDDFSENFLDLTKWEIRNDTEGQSLMEEYWVDNETNVFHTLQNTTGDYRTYLFPKYNFTTGDIFQYETNLIFKENNYIQMVLLEGENQSIRIGIFGYINGIQGYDELGQSLIRIAFQENNLILHRTSPSGELFNDTLNLNIANGTYNLYIGSVSGHNGRVHIDYDNFVFYSKHITEIEVIPEAPVVVTPPSSGGGGGGGGGSSYKKVIKDEPQDLETSENMETEITELKEKVEDLEKRTSLIESIINKIKEFIKNLPEIFK